MGTMIAGTSPRSGTGGGRDLAWYSIGAAVPLVFIPPFFCSAASPHPPPTPAGFPLTLPTSAPLSPSLAGQPLPLQPLGHSTAG